MSEGCTCQECGTLFKVDLMLPNDLWERIKPEKAEPGGGLLCGVCIMRKLEEFNTFGYLIVRESGPLLRRRCRALRRPVPGLLGGSEPGYIQSALGEKE